MNPSHIAAPLAALALLSACAGAPELQGKPLDPPGSGGGYNPGGGSGPSGSYGAGASGAGGPSSGSGGEGGMVDPGPPMCDDALKRCAHVFTFPAGNESKVEVHGDFAPDGWAVGVPMEKVGGQWTATIDVPWAVDVQYKLVVDGVWMADPNEPNTIDDGFGGKNSLLSGVTCAEWTCDVETMGTFDWRDAVLDFVFVDRFLDGDPSNNGPTPPGVDPPAAYRGGDWAGVTKKINEGYFNDLGVNALWLSVPADNTENSGFGSDGHKYSAYHGYWPTNLDKPENRFGTMAELKALVDAAHGKKIKVILDYAMNHVHVDSPLYAQHKDWFWPLNDGAVNNCTCGGGCSWDGDQGKRCWFTDYLPDFNFKNQAARDYSVNNALGWIKDTGVDGFRLDAVKHIEDAWLTDLRAAVKAQIEPATGEHFYMVGETFTGDQGLIKYYVNPSMLDGQFDFPLRAKLLRSILMRANDPSSTMQALDGFLGQNQNVYGSGIMSTFIGNHDIPRPIHFAEDNPVWGNEWDSGKDKAWNNLPALPGGTSAFERVANAYTVLFTTKGVPLVYYGDEVAMPGAGDPDNRRMMQWSNYSAGQSLVKGHIQKLTKIRADHAALRRGTRTGLSSSSDTMAYKMVSGGDTVYVLVNRSDSSQVVGGLPGGMLKDLLTGNTVSGASVAVPARKSMILVAP